MNFDFSDDQRMLRDHARRFLSEAGDFHSLRQTLASGEGYSQALWQQISEQGWQGVAIAETHGGLELGMLELCVLAEELGRVVAPVPFFSTVCLAAEVLKRCPGEISDNLLQRVVTGEAIVATGLLTPDQEWNDTTVTFSNGKLSGRSAPLAYAGHAGSAILPVLDQGQPALALVDLQNVDRQALGALDATVPFARLHLENTPAELLCSGNQAHLVMTRVVNQAAVLTAFEQLGGADAALEITRNYALERFTFGRAIGSYQAVKHKLADMAVKIELARSNAYYGAWALQDGSDEQLAAAAALARLSAGEAYEYAAEECLHLHGGIGYTWEADCHFFYKRARLLAVSLGSSSAWVDRLLSDASLHALHS
ncbi:acyl-CoA dehydrogenase family protein [Stutzerimonas stutzeri]|uniref:acyl-CoA dehydrogenase family protein n=1 Tax=Stutzerimonas stutzeri TaxID=316 RepID=UPI00244CC4CE|nr:acyl-CoA/acyl-ACP dehydrogenase [Stutzerimonas stutzeri]MDH0426649.1 acyl-CoA/acyl-ACP dehydrogenase [Stutzerimonas stutzeri]